MKSNSGNWGFCDWNIPRCRNKYTNKAQETAKHLQEVELRMLTKKACEDKLGTRLNFDKKHEMCTVGLYNRKYRTVTLKERGKKKNNFEWKFVASEDTEYEDDKYGIKVQIL